jgi:histidine triad (HIT) family protein
MTDIFCKIINHEVNDFIFYEDKFFIAVFDTEPINPGHSLLIPKKHFETVQDYDEPTAKRFTFAQQNIIHLLQKNIPKITAFTLYQSNGNDAHQTISHSHLHIIPRYPDDFGTTTLDSNHPKKSERNYIQNGQNGF